MIRFIKRFYLGLIMFFLYSPIAVLIFYSFNASKSRANWGGFTLNWYVELFNDPSIIEALRNTLVIAVLSAALSTIIGTGAAVAIDRMGPIKRRVVMNITNLHVLSPDIVIGVSLMLLYIFAFRMLGFGNLGFATLLFSHTAFNVPYVILSVLPKLKQLDENLLEAALDLGATPLYAFFKIILPEVMPGIITGAILAFTLSIDDVVISFFTTGSGMTNLSITIFSMARRGINPKINALSTLMFLAVLVLLYIVNRRDSSKVTKVE